MTATIPCNHAPEAATNSLIERPQDTIHMTRAFAIAAPLAIVLGLSACAVDPNAPQRSSDADPNANRRQGAITGGLIGAVAGAALDDDERLRGAIIGGALGAGGGAAIGNRLDRQEAALRSQLNSSVGIVNTGNELIVTLPQDILFETDSAALTGSLRSDLAALARSLNEFPQSTVDIIGHADNTGTAAYNQDLSARRAQAVSRTLANNGVSPARLRAFGRGEDEPIASNLTPQGRAQNRRVEIVIRPTA